jgi:hypothetical protein
VRIQKVSGHGQEIQYQRNEDNVVTVKDLGPTLAGPRTRNFPDLAETLSLGESP